jgi:hypothetical protein
MRTISLLTFIALMSLTLNSSDLSRFYSAYLTHGELQELARETALRYGVDVSLIFAMIQQESGWKTKVVSHAGAIGIMQIMPNTGKGFCGLNKEQLTDPRQNLDCGVRYFKKQLRRFGTVELALCAYNAGPSRAKKGRCSNSETRNYIRNITAMYNRTKENLSAKDIAEKMLVKANNSNWWRLVCEAIDVVYDREIGKVEPQAVGQSAKTPLQINTWKTIFQATVDDLEQDEIKKKGQGDNPILNRNTIKNKIKKACPKGPRHTRQI